MLEHTEIEQNKRVDTEAKKAAIDFILSYRCKHNPPKLARVRYIKVAAKK